MLFFIPLFYMDIQNNIKTTDSLKYFLNCCC